MKVLIIGASFAGLACAQEVKRLYPAAQVTLVDRESLPLYQPNAFNRLLKGDITAWSETQFPLWQAVISSVDECLLGCDCRALHPQEQEVTIVQDGQSMRVSYDYLVLATGARQAEQLAQAELVPELLTFKSLASSQKSLERLSNAASVIVVGAGQLGLESLDALCQTDLSLRLVEAQPLPLAKHLDEQMGQLLLEQLKQQQITCHFRETVEQARRDQASGQVVVETTRGVYQADALLLATNFTPNSQWFKEQLRLLPDGTVQVDAYLRTSQPRIFAVGDLIALPHEQFGQAYMPMISHALLTGRLAALNLLAPKVALGDSQRLISSSLFGLEVLSVGLTQREASLWLKTQVTYCGQETSHLSLVIEPEKQIVLGVQLLAPAISQELKHLLNLALASRWSVGELLTVKGLHALPASQEKDLLYRGLCQALEEVSHAD